MNGSAGDHLLFCNHFASHKLTCENKTSLLEDERQPSNDDRLNTIDKNNFTDTIVPISISITYYYCNIGPSNIIFLKILFVFDSCFIFLIECVFYYFVICKCMDVNSCNNARVQFIFFLAMRLKLSLSRVAIIYSNRPLLFIIKA